MQGLARALRKQLTDAERMLWKHLRAKRLAGYKFRRQVVIEPYIVDFVCYEAKLIIEVDGGQHAEMMDEDANRTAYLESLRYTVIRFWNHEVLNEIEAVLEQVYDFLNDPLYPSRGYRGPQPLPRRGRG